MKNKLSIGLMTIFLGAGMFTLSSAAEAYYCEMVPAHWSNGHRVPAQKVCWRGRTHCKWVPAHWRNGYWHEGHYVCTKRYY